MQGKNIPSNQSECMFFIFIETFYRNFFHKVEGLLIYMSNLTI